MITDHRFVGLRQWGIDPPSNAPCQFVVRWLGSVRCNMPKSQHVNLCRGVANLKGEHIPCDLIEPHDGWAHANKEHELVWADEPWKGLAQ